MAQAAQPSAGHANDFQLAIQQDATTTRSVSQASEYISALADSSVTTIQLKQDITLTERDWLQYIGTLPLPIQRTVTTVTAPGELYAATLDVSFVPAKLAIMPDGRFHSIGVMVVAPKSFSSLTVYNVDLLTSSPEPAAGQRRAVLSQDQGFLTYEVCPPPNVFMTAMLLVRRPLELPGMQRVSVPRSSLEPCSPTAPRVPPQYAGLPRLCLNDFAVEGAEAVIGGGVTRTNYNMHLTNTTVVCVRSVDASCVRQYGIIGCLELAERQLAEQRDAAAAPEAAAPGNYTDVLGRPSGAASAGPIEAQGHEPVGADAGSSGSKWSEQSQPPQPGQQSFGQRAGQEAPPGADHAGGVPQQQAPVPPVAGGTGSVEHAVGAEVIAPVVATGVVVLLLAAGGAALWARRRRRRAGGDNSNKCTPLAGVRLHLGGCAKGHWGSAAGQASAPGGSSARPTAPGSSAMTPALDDPGGVASSETACCCSGRDATVGSSAIATAVGTCTSTAASVQTPTSDTPLQSAALASSLMLKFITPLTCPVAGVRLDLRWGEDVVVRPDALLGAGSFGRVLVGTLAGHQGEVAVKVLKGAAAGSSHLNKAAVRQCKMEVEVLSRCRHPNVVTLLGACLEPPHVCLVLELMDLSLEQLLREQAAGALLPMDQVLRIAVDVAQGLAYLHPTVTHRDLKPANVLLDKSGTAKLSDFGLARLRTSMLPTVSPEAGTVPYMAPECFDIDNFIVTPKADIYSFGVLLWECLSGKAPWHGLCQLEVAMRVSRLRQRLPLHELGRQRCSPKLRRLLAQCWEEDPRRRPSADEVLKTLQLAQLALQQRGAVEEDVGEEADDGTGGSGPLPIPIEVDARPEQPERPQLHTAYPITQSAASFSVVCLELAMDVAASPNPVT